MAVHMWVVFGNLQASLMREASQYIGAIRLQKWALPVLLEPFNLSLSGEAPSRPQGEAPLRGSPLKGKPLKGKLRGSPLRGGGLRGLKGFEVGAVTPTSLPPENFPRHPPLLEYLSQIRPRLPLFPRGGG